MQNSLHAADHELCIVLTSAFDMLHAGLTNVMQMICQQVGMQMGLLMGPLGCPVSTYLDQNDSCGSGSRDRATMLGTKIHPEIASLLIVEWCAEGSGSTKTEWGSITWAEGDVFVLPAASRPVVHHADAESKDGAAFYWVHDEPLMTYLGVKPNETRFEPTLFRAEVCALLSETSFIRKTHLHRAF